MLLTLDGRLLCASTHAYSIKLAGSVPDTFPPPNPPRSQLVGYLQPPVGFSTGADLIDSALIGAIAEGTLIAFRGTLPPTSPNTGQMILDWASDADAPFVAGQHLPGLVHQGFLCALDALWPAMEPLIRQILLTNPQVPFLITGHSKGGAVAHLAAMRIRSQFPGLPVTVRTFAAARSGDAAFGAAYALSINDSLRYEYADDIVPHLPPGDVLMAAMKTIPLIGNILGNLTLGYVSVGQLKFIGSDGAIQDDSPGLKANRIKSLINLLRAYDFKTIAADHGIGPGSGYGGAICPGY